MGVYFALRTHYDFLTGKYLRRFPEDESVLSWFQQRWSGENDDHKLLGTDVYGFSSLFEAIAEHNLPVPESEQQLAAILQEHLYAEGEIIATPHAIQVLTDDDELELAYYFFDDHYRTSKQGEKAAYLLHDQDQLPTSLEPVTRRLPILPPDIEVKHPGGTGEGVVYGVFITFSDSASLSDLSDAVDSFQIAGIRLPELVAYLENCPPDENSLRDWELLHALAVIPHHDPADDKSLATLLTRVGKFPVTASGQHDSRFYGATASEERASFIKMVAKITNDPQRVRSERSFVQAEEHVAQLCLHTDTWKDRQGDTLLFCRWIFFDDVWLRAHPALGIAILRFGTRWDVLT